MHVALPVRPPHSVLRVLARRPGQSRNVATLSLGAKSQIADTHMFTDHRMIYEHQATDELLRSLLVLRLCSFVPFVQNSYWLLGGTTGFSGKPRWIRESLYRHFLAGHAAADVWARVNVLRAHGVGVILDYAEQELPHSAPPPTANLQPKLPTQADADADAVRQHQHQPQAKAICERQAEVFMSSIHMAAVQPGQGFARVKLSALGGPRLLGHLAAAVTRVTSLFEQYDSDRDGVISRTEFQQCYERLSGAQETGGQESADADASTPPGRCADGDGAPADGSGGVDYVRWVRRVGPRQLMALAEHLDMGVGGSPAGAPARCWLLSAAEEQQLSSLVERLEMLAERAVEKGVKLIITDDLGSVRPALDHLAHHLMRRYNRPAPATQEGSSRPAVPDGVGGRAGQEAGAGAGAGPGGGQAAIFVTHQAHSPDAPARLAADLARAGQEQYVLGVKLVSGLGDDDDDEEVGAAAAEQPQPVAFSPASAPSSASPFASCLEVALHAARGGAAEVMVGSHQPAHVEMAVALMGRLGLEPAEAPVYFGQVLGVADNISFTLGNGGYRVYKDCPYGHVDKVTAYLVRRIRETQRALQAGGHEDLRLVQAELWRRLAWDPTLEAASWIASLLPATASGERDKGGRGGQDQDRGQGRGRADPAPSSQAM